MRIYVYKTVMMDISKLFFLSICVSADSLVDKNKLYYSFTHIQHSLGKITFSFYTITPRSNSNDFINCYEQQHILSLSVCIF